MNKNNLETIRKNINKAILDSNKSRLKITELADVSYPNLTRFLNNKKPSGLSLDVLDKLAKVLNVPVSYFLGSTDRTGVPVTSVENEPLPDDWDALVKRIMSMSEKDRGKLLPIFKACVNAIQK